MDPCPTAELTLLPNQIQNVNQALRDPATSQEWFTDQVMVTNVTVDCGPILVDFYNDDLDKSGLD